MLCRPMFRISLLIGLLLPYASVGQEGQALTMDRGCTYFSAEARERVLTFMPEDRADEITATIVRLSGLNPNFEVRSASVANAEASIGGGRRWILYNPDFIREMARRTGSEWPAIVVLAHEIGHHLNGHTLESDGSRPAIEREADHFSGFIAQKMGASLAATTLIWQHFGTPFATETHPSKRDRLDQVSRGWKQACDASPDCSGVFRKGDYLFHGPVAQDLALTESLSELMRLSSTSLILDVNHPGLLWVKSDLNATPSTRRLRDGEATTVQDARPVRVAVVDMALAFADSQEGQSFKRWSEQEIQLIEAERQAAWAAGDYERGRRLTAQAEETLFQRWSNAKRALEEKIEAVCTTSGFDVVLNKFESDLLFAADELDLTDEIVRAMGGSAPAARTDQVVPLRIGLLSVKDLARNRSPSDWEKFEVEAMNVIKEIGDEGGFALIFNFPLAGSIVRAAAPELELTRAVIAGLEAGRWDQFVPAEAPPTKAQVIDLSELD